MSEFGHALAEASRRMLEAEQRPCERQARGLACIVGPESHTEFECNAVAHRNSWHGAILEPCPPDCTSAYAEAD